MSFAGIFSALTSSLRSGNTPCEWVQTIIRPLRNVAIAQDGPIEPWARYGLV